MARSTTHERAVLFIGPAMIMFAVFVLYSIFYIFYAGLFRWDGINAKSFVVLDNYIRMFSADEPFRISLRNALYWAVLTIFPQMFLGFALALLLDSGIPGQTLFRAIFYIPAIISPVVIGIVWQRIYNPFGGLLSDIGFATGARFLTQPFLANPQAAIFAVILVNIWQWTGFSMLLYIAGLQEIPAEIIEAARLDGASSWQIVRRVIWPVLRHVHLTLILLGIIGTLQTFPLIYMLTQGGPNHATELLPNYIFQQAFHLQSMGYASALSVVLLMISLLASVFQVRVLGARFSLAG
ncbi:MAG: sugar ABC transporter permease [Methylobacteriaceae bacterium]|nr:sugar ABC transporter permease [Methylobacteriaceae bacterium]MBV9247338.1 sugar ABC transporter permease [Methylobacteriaceae bacterium]